MNWIKMLATGFRPDQSGNIKDWTQADLDHVVATYDPARHEAPVIIGEARHDAPAYGWIRALKREGNALYMRLKSDVPEFLEMLKKGLFKKLAVSFYPDFTLRHVGFLGAPPPKIEGLNKINFKEKGEVIMYEFSENDNMSAGERLHFKILEFLESPRGKDIKYGEAFNIVSREETDLVKEYLEESRRSVKPPQSSEIAEKRLMEKIGEKLKEKKGLSFAEAMYFVEIENPELIQEYLSESRGE